MTAALRFLLLAEVAGLAALPLAGALFARTPGRGLGVAKPLGLLLAVWLTWLAGSLGVPYGVPSAAGGLGVVAIAGLVAWRRGWVPAMLGTRRLWLWAEALFAVAFLAMALLNSYSPDVWNTEKPMDMALVNASNASTSFPPHDPWMSGEQVNYYYLGHVMAAWMIRLTGVEPTVGYNLALALFFALSAVAVFSVTAGLWGFAKEVGAPGPTPAAVGLLGVLATVVLGNLESAAKLLHLDGGVSRFDWFSTTRVIPDTIDEFPIFSWILGDLHAHAIATPYLVLAVGLALQVALTGARLLPLEIAATGLVLGWLYGMNAWSYPVAAGLIVLGALLWMRNPLSAGTRRTAAFWVVGVVIASILVLLPFHLSFDPAAKGVGRVHSHRHFTLFVRDQAMTLGLFWFVVGGAFVARLIATARPWRNFVWGAAAAVLIGAALASHHLAGVAVLSALTAAALAITFGPGRLSAPERAIWLLVAGAIACTLLPDVVYLRDAFDGGASYRMNTVFKFLYSAWILFAIASACIVAARGWLPRWSGRTWLIGVVVLGLFSLAFPYAGTYSRKAAFADGPHLDGMRWLARTAPGDVEAITWLRDHSGVEDVVLEAVGDDYSSFGHARISTYTGRATVMGWQGHELQWEHNPGSRKEEVKQAYVTTDSTAARATLARYGVDWVVVGPLERADYGDAGVAKWDALGRRAFERDGTTIWRISAA